MRTIPVLRALFGCFLMLLCLLGSQAGAQEAGVLEGPGGLIERYTLPNGVTVLLQPVPDLPTAAVVLAVPVGAAQDPEARPGTCRLLAQLLSRSPSSYPQGSLLLDLEEMGARSGYRVLPRWTEFHETVPRQHLSWLLALQMDRLRPARWSAEEIERQQMLLKEDWRSEGLTPLGAENRLLLGLLQGGNLAQEPDSIPVTELQQFALQYWNPPVARGSSSGPILAVVGGFSSRAVREQLAKLGVGGGAAAPSTPDKAPPSEPATAELGGSPEVQWLYPLPAKADEMAVLALLDSTLRETGAGLTSQIDFLQNTYSVRMTGSAEAEKELRDRLKRMSLSLMDPTQLKVAQSIALRRFYRHFDDIEQRALQLALDQGASGLERLTRYPEMIKQLTPATIAQAATQILNEKKAAKVKPGAGPFTPAAYKGRSTGPDLGRSSPPKVSSAPDFRSKAEPPPGFTRLELDRGITILVQTVQDLPTITVRGYFSGGANLDPAGLAGRSQLVSRALDERVKAHPRWPDSALELRFSPQVQYLGIEGWTPRDALADWLTILVTALSPDPIPDGLVESSRTHLLRGYEREMSNPETQAYQRWLGMLFSEEHPLGRSSLRYFEGTRLLTAQQVNQHLATMVRPNRLTLTFSGDITAPEVAQKLNPLIANLAPPDPQISFAAPSSPRPTSDTPQVVRFKGALSQPLVLTGTLAPSRKDPDYYAFSLLNQILGGESVTSRLAIRLRHKDQSVSLVQSRFLSGQGPSPFLISLKVRPGHLEEALTAVQEEVERLRNQPVSEQELQRAVHNLEGQLQVAQANSPGRASLMRNLELFHLSDNYATGFAGLYRSFTPKDLQDVAKRRLQPGSFCTVVVEPES